MKLIFNIHHTMHPNLLKINVQMIMIDNELFVPCFLHIFSLKNTSTVKSLRSLLMHKYEDVDLPYFA